VQHHAHHAAPCGFLIGNRLRVHRLNREIPISRG